MSEPAGWLPDPYGRFQQRYWDGSQWTAHVVANGQQQVDPLGTTASIPFAIPPTALDAPVAPAAKSNPIVGLLDRMAPDSRERPPADMATALAGIGGTVVALGVFAGIVGDHGNRGKVLLAAVIVLAAALGVRLSSLRVVAARAAAVGAGAAGITGLVVAAAFTSAQDAWPSFLAAALFFAAWALPGFFGRPLMLGIAAFTLTNGISTAVAGNGRASGLFGDIAGADSTSEGVAFLLCGAALMAGVYLLDRRGYRGTATSLVAAGLLASVGGTTVLAADLSDSGGAALATATGIVIAIVGHHGQRRATTWVGSLVIAVGLIGLLFNSIKPTSVGGISSVLIGCGALLILVPAIVLVIRKQNRETATP